MHDDILEQADTYKDLGVYFFLISILAIQLVNLILCWDLQKKHFRELSWDCFVTLHKPLLRSHLEYANTIWAPKRICDIEKSKKLKKATKIIRGLSGLRYEERLCFTTSYLKIYTAKGDMIQSYKHVTNKYDVNFKSKVYYRSMLDMLYDTKGNRYKLVPGLCKYELRKQFFVNRVVKLWNTLPDEVVSVSSVSSSKRQ